MKLTLIVFALGLASLASCSFYTVKPLPSTAIDTSFLKTANSKKTPTFAQLSSFLEQLRDVSKVQEFLDGLLENLAVSRQEKLAIVEQTRASCDEEEAFRTQAIAEGKNGASAAQAQITLCQGQKDTAQHLQELAQTAITLYQGQLEDATTTRNQQHAEYETKSAKLNTLLDNVAQLNELIDQFEAEANAPLNNFVQITNNMLKIGVKTGHSHLVLPIYQMLIQMHAKQSVDADKLAQLRQLVSLLSQHATEALQALDDEEVQRVQVYEELFDKLTALVARLASQVAQTAAFEATMDQCLAQENSIFNLSNDKFSRNTDLLVAAQQLCQASENEWKQYELSRTKEVSVINALKSAVNAIEQQYEVEVGPQVDASGTLKLL